MSALVTSVVKMYDELGMSIDEICLEEKLENVVVISVLAQGSKKYREEMKGEIELGDEMEVSKDELKEYIESYKMLRYAEEDHIKERVLRNLINYQKKVTDGLGANDPKKMLGAIRDLNPMGKVLELNERLREMREAKRAKLLENSIDVELVGGK
jgi:hypothetical protein